MGQPGQVRAARAGLLRHRAEDTVRADRRAVGQFFAAASRMGWNRYIMCIDKKIAPSRPV